MQWILRFNGTTFFQTWKLLNPKREWVNSIKLQWNHVFSNVEMSGHLRHFAHLFVASMEPRFFKRGNESENSYIFFLNAGFNGTTFFQTWKF